MTPAEYIQLKAFARIDGAYVGVAWIISFALYIYGLSSPLLGMCGVMIALFSPFVAALRLRRFRDIARDGIISFRRSMAYYIYIFFYASLLFALAQYIYFAYIDGGYLVRSYAALMESPETMAMMKDYGLTEKQMTDNIAMLGEVNPIYIVLNILTMNIAVGIVMSIPVAAMMKRTAHISNQ